jgi:uncharacterized protein (TIGR02147 family)
MSIFNFKDYRSYLLSKVGSAGTRKGVRKALAEFIPVHTTFISQVLSSKADFSLEQAEQVNLFFEHTDQEAEYFFLLVNFERAGSKKLKERFQTKIDSILNERLRIKNRIQKSNEISKEDQVKFYSSFHFAALHVLASIPQFQSVNEMSKQLNISLQKCKEHIDFLLKLSLVSENQGRLTAGTRNIHLPDDNLLIAQHHSNWRLACLQALQDFNKSNFHYSACVSLSKEDVNKVKEILLEGLNKKAELIGKSKEETAYGLNLDFFKIA